MAAARRTSLPAETVDAERVLAFVNTLSARTTPAPVERLVSWDALVEWAREARVVPPSAADRIKAEAARHPHQASSALARAIELREALQAVFAAVAAGRAPAASSLETLSEHVSAAYARGRLVPHETALAWVSPTDASLDRIQWELGRAAGRLVTSERLARVRACAAHDCGWWFVDDTKNHSRRWCDMKICGNREKLRRFRAKS